MSEEMAVLIRLVRALRASETIGGCSYLVELEEAEKLIGKLQEKKG